MLRWPTALLLAAMSVAGCRRAQPTFDPFLPRTRIPPPATGAATGAPDANYTNPVPPMTGGAPNWPTPGAPSAAPSDLYSPPGGYQYPQPTPAPGAVSPAPVTVPAQPATTSNSPGIGQVPRANRMKYVATADTSRSAAYERDDGADASQKQPQLAVGDTSSEVDIMDLPPVNRVARGE